MHKDLLNKLCKKITLEYTKFENFREKKKSTF